jgi:hypothetical protein
MAKQTLLLVALVGAMVFALVVVMTRSHRNPPLTANVIGLTAHSTSR